MDRKREFVELAGASGANVRELCRRWSRRPGGSPGPAAGAAEHPGPLQRFERATPSELWQIKGHFALHAGRCHPLTALDDCSRYNLVLSACGDEQAATVKGALEGAFRRYGMPLAMLMDWRPWGDSGGEPLSGLTVWLMRLGVRVLHGRPRHPQTQGKQARFHRTLEAEAMAGRSFRDLAECQRAFDVFRHRCNHERPHEALGP